MENLPSGVSLLKVSASDADVGANGQISYSLHGPHAQHFRMDSRTGGSLTVAAAAAIYASNRKNFRPRAEFEVFGILLRKKKGLQFLEGERIFELIKYIFLMLQSQFAEPSTWLLGGVTTHL